MKHCYYYKVVLLGPTTRPSLGAGCLGAWVLGGGCG